MDADCLGPFEVNIYDQQGQLCLLIEGFSMRRMTQATEPKVAQEQQASEPLTAQSTTQLQGRIAKDHHRIQHTCTTPPQPRWPTCIENQQRLHV